MCVCGYAHIHLNTSRPPNSYLITTSLYRVSGKYIVLGEYIKLGECIGSVYPEKDTHLLFNQ